MGDAVAPATQLHHHLPVVPIITPNKTTLNGNITSRERIKSITHSNSN